MKRKRWSELEEQTLLTKYSDLLNFGTLTKLKTREKKIQTHRRSRLVSAQVLELRDFVMRREMEWSREVGVLEREERSRETKLHKENIRNERDEETEIKELELEERQMVWARREFDNRMRFEREFDEERRRRLKMEEKIDEEELEWRERMLNIQIEHEKQMGVVGAGRGCDGGGGEDEGWYLGFEFEFEFKEEEEEEGEVEVEKMTILPLNEVMC